jgi:N-acyl-D-aspartate/D-glutamate deacylase
MPGETSEVNAGGKLVSYDLPPGGRRLAPRVDGHDATRVAGVPVFEGGGQTGAPPGKLVRASA